MARIMKVRTIPRGYLEVEGLRGFVTEKCDLKPSEWFMPLYSKFGNPQTDGIWSYLLRHNNVVMKVTAKDKDVMEYTVWVSPGFMYDAKKRRTRKVNIIARRLNEKGVIFDSEKDNDKLYYAVVHKNSELRERKKCTEEEIKAAMEDTLTSEEKNALYGDISQYMTDVKEEIVRTINEITDGEKRV